MDSMLYAMEAHVVPPRIEDMLAEIPDKKKDKYLINSYKVMMNVSERERERERTVHFYCTCEKTFSFI